MHAWPQLPAPDLEERRKYSVLLMAMIIFTVYASFLVLSATIYEGPFFTFLRSLAIGFLAADVVLLALLYHSRNLVLVTWLFLALVDSGTIAICFNFGLVSQYIMWLLFIPILLFFIVGRQAGSWGLVFILIQLTIFVPLSTYVFTPRDSGLLLVPPIHEWFVSMMTYTIVGGTAFVHEGSRHRAFSRLKLALEEAAAARQKLSEAAQAKSYFLANFSHGMPRCPQPRVSIHSALGCR
jgi:hypothetical protein